MNIHEPNPPRWAEAMLRSVLRPSEREPISGDLLEEYRAARRPRLGAVGANAWYIRHVLSVLWHLIRPWALTAAMASVTLSLTVFRPGHHAPGFQPGPAFPALIARGLIFGSVVPAPGVSLIHALIYFWSGYYAFQRTRLVRTATLAALATSGVGFTILFAAAAMITPSLVLAPFDKPFIFVILSVYLLVPAGYAALVGALAGVIGRQLPGRNGGQKRFQRGQVPGAI